MYYLNSRYYDAKLHRFINADECLSSASTETNGFNLFSYCFNNPVMYTDSDGNWPKWLENIFDWVEKNVIVPISNFCEKLEEDLLKLDKNNESEEDVLDANYISYYKGQLVIKTSLVPTAFSYGVMVMNPKYTSTIEEHKEIVKHEYGHFLQLKELGIVDYTKFVAIPSVTGFCMDLSNEEYYSLPWEYGADLYGGVSGRTYQKETQEKYERYWNIIKWF